jgi:hypothetical protein
MVVKAAGPQQSPWFLIIWRIIFRGKSVALTKTIGLRRGMNMVCID